MHLSFPSCTRFLLFHYQHLAIPTVKQKHPVYCLIINKVDYAEADSAYYGNCNRGSLMVVSVYVVKCYITKCNDESGTEESAHVRHFHHVLPLQKRVSTQSLGNILTFDFLETRRQGTGLTILLLSDSTLSRRY